MEAQALYQRPHVRVAVGQTQPRTGCAKLCCMRGDASSCVNLEAQSIDLRSDICAAPTHAMWDAMRTADLGWATYGEDESVNELERRGGALLAKEAAVLVPTCSMANLVALLALTAPGQRVAVEANAHVVVNEGDWLTEVARLVSVAPGEAADVVVLENTHTRRGGTLLTAAETAERAALAPLSHLDG